MATGVDREMEGRLDALRDALLEIVAHLPAESSKRICASLEKMGQAAAAASPARAAELTSMSESLAAARAAALHKDPEVLEEQLDEGLVDTFPASDPVAVTSRLITGAGPEHG